MPLDEATRRFAFLLQRDLRRLTERREEHAARGEEMEFDTVSRVATFPPSGSRPRSAGSLAMMSNTTGTATATMSTPNTIVTVWRPP